jgi:YD repeat-containing protein
MKNHWCKSLFAGCVSIAAFGASVAYAAKRVDPAFLREMHESYIQRRPLPAPISIFEMSWEITGFGYLNNSPGTGQVCFWISQSNWIGGCGSTAYDAAMATVAAREDFLLRVQYPNGWSGELWYSYDETPTGPELVVSRVGIQGLNPQASRLFVGVSPQNCRVGRKNGYLGDPFEVASGNLFESRRLLDYPFDFSIYYNSSNSGGNDFYLGWTTELSRSLLPAYYSGVRHVGVSRPEGDFLDFTFVDGSWVSSSPSRTVLKDLSGGGNILFVDGVQVETYDASGAVRQIIKPNGVKLTVSDVPAGKVVMDNFGRGYTLGLGSAGKIAYIDLLQGRRLIEFQPSNGNPGLLDAVFFGARESGANRINLIYSDNNFPALLTGVVDEKSVAENNYRPYMSWTPNGAGGVNGSSLSGGVNSTNVTRISPGGGDYLVTESNHTSTMTYSFINGANRLIKMSQPAGAGCDASSSQIAYDANGNKISVDDFNGNRVCYVNDSSRNLEASRIEGLQGGSNATDCSMVVGDGVNLSTLLPGRKEVRKVSTEWHPQWALKIKEAQPKLLTTWVYNGQPDPFNGNQLANCVTNTYGGNATLPDGSAIAVLCKKVEQATTDSDGSQGFNAALDNADNSRVWQRVSSNTYTEYGQVLTQTDPVGNMTTYGYYTDGPSMAGTVPNESGHYPGDLKTITNAKGHVTNFTQYSRDGRVKEVVAPSGLVTAYAYSGRGWVTRVKQCSIAPCDPTTADGGLLSILDYWPTGLLKRATQPDGSYLDYTYDDAHRLIGVADAAGNTVTYTLDNAGNRIGEQVKDLGGTLARNITRTFDALNRLQTVTGAAQ